MFGKGQHQKWPGLTPPRRRRDTIAKMCRYSAPSRYVRSKAPERPKLGPLVPVIDVILEADKTAPPKQRPYATPAEDLGCIRGYISRVRTGSMLSKKGCVTG
jgi:hypothetical protein